jgi:hypothetical protein
MPAYSSSPSQTPNETNDDRARWNRPRGNVAGRRTQDRRPRRRSPSPTSRGSTAICARRTRRSTRSISPASSESTSTTPSTSIIRRTTRLSARRSWGASVSERRSARVARAGIHAGSWEIGDASLVLNDDQVVTIMPERRQPIFTETGVVFMRSLWRGR